MNRERWEEIRGLVKEALGEGEESRQEFLVQSCADDAALRLGAEALLSWQQDKTQRLPQIASTPLAPEQWQRIEQLFQSALELEPTERSAFLAQACGDDLALRREVESLLVYQAAAGGMIQGAIHQAADLLANTSAAPARFTPGTTLNKRYRIMGLLGRGGMGEVYRADDLKLGQPVALKFLTDKLSLDKTMLARFHSEVAMAHRVTHPNVCRVHDIGEVTTSSGTLHFLTMEYVDGEDLSSLLRRIGRLPSDKAVEIANQLCAGLAAAHEAGVLHRDLKPANVMIDGKGRVRITDFGLAGFAEQISGKEVFAGTPAYISPEQFAGKEVTIKSDIYALGLVLYEIFTGKRVFEGSSLDELKRLHESSSPTNPSSWVKDIDPLVERVILRCLEKDPSKRLSSAKQVADALPGGDPLAAALALGETPSPEMVAAAGSKTGMKPGAAVACLFAVLVALFLIAVLGNKVQVSPMLLRDNSPEVLAHKARELIQSLGYTDNPADNAYGLAYDYDYLNYIAQNVAHANQFDQLTKGRPPAIYFWYRESPQYMTGFFVGSFSRVSEYDPPSTNSGMIQLKLNPQGKLIEFQEIPPQLDQTSEASPPPNWKMLFAAAGLELEGFTPTEPQWTSLATSDVRVAWTGSYQGGSAIPLRIEAAAYRGKPVYFQLVWPWTKPTRMQFQQNSAGIINITIWIFLFLAVGIAAIFLARRNLRNGRGDRRGALRLALLLLLMGMINWLFGAHHVPTIIVEAFGFIMVALNQSLLMAAVVWLFYIALEPYVRRRWPITLISWSRVLDGRLRDPLVGRDLLVGILFGLSWSVFYLLVYFGEIRLGRQSVNVTNDTLGSPSPLLGIRLLIADVFLNNLQMNLLVSLLLLLFLFFLRILCRRQWLASCIYVSLGILIGSLQGDHLVGGLYLGLIYLALLTILLRFGFTAMVMGSFVQGLAVVPITTDFSAWYANSSIIVILSILVMTGYVFHTSLGGQKVFSGKLLEE